MVRPKRCGENMVINEGKITFDKSRQTTPKRATKSRLFGRPRRGLKTKKKPKTFFQANNHYEVVADK
jgi:hypothetical protein